MAADVLIICVGALAVVCFSRSPSGPDSGTRSVILLAGCTCCCYCCYGALHKRILLINLSLMRCTIQHMCCESLLCAFGHVSRVDTFDVCVCLRIRSCRRWVCSSGIEHLGSLSGVRAAVLFGTPCIFRRRRGADHACCCFAPLMSAYAFVTAAAVGAGGGSSCTASQGECRHSPTRSSTQQQSHLWRQLQLDVRDSAVSTAACCTQYWEVLTAALAVPARLVGGEVVLVKLNELFIESFRAVQEVNELAGSKWPRLDLSK